MCSMTSPWNRTRALEATERALICQTMDGRRSTKRRCVFRHRFERGGRCWRPRADPASRLHLSPLPQQLQLSILFVRPALRRASTARRRDQCCAARAVRVWAISGSAPVQQRRRRRPTSLSSAAAAQPDERAMTSRDAAAVAAAPTLGQVAAVSRRGGMKHP